MGSAASILTPHSGLAMGVKMIFIVANGSLIVLTNLCA